MDYEEVVSLCLSLEEKGLSHSEINDYLEHVGVKGMKWGFRKGKKKTGVNRFYGAKMDINNRRIYRRQHRIDKTGYAASAALGRAFYMSKDRQLDHQKQTISKLKAQNKRVSTGKATTMDKIGTYAGIPISMLIGFPAPMRGPSLSGVLVSRAPKSLK